MFCLSHEFSRQTEQRSSYIHLSVFQLWTEGTSCLLCKIVPHHQKRKQFHTHKLTELSILQILRTFCLTDTLLEAQRDKSNASSSPGSVPALLSKFSSPCSLSGNNRFADLYKELIMGKDKNKCWNFSLCKIVAEPELQQSRVLWVHMLYDVIAKVLSTPWCTGSVTPEIYIFLETFPETQASQIHVVG